MEVYYSLSLKYLPPNPCFPLAPCMEGLVPNVAVFRGRVFERDWVIRTLKLINI